LEIKEHYQIEELKTTYGLEQVIESWRDTCNADDFGMDMDVPTFIKSFQDIIISQDSILFGAIADNGIVGILGVFIFDSPIGKNLMANEHFWYVVPEHRKGTIGRRLVKKAIEWAKSKGCTHFVANASMLASNLHDNVCSFYKLIGMNKFESTYIMEIGEK
jgi:GNAT superfamily N-acetyltransferase